MIAQLPPPAARVGPGRTICCCRGRRGNGVVTVGATLSRWPPIWRTERVGARLMGCSRRANSLRLRVRRCPRALNKVRIATQAWPMDLGCDLVVGASKVRCRPRRTAARDVAKQPTRPHRGAFQSGMPNLHTRRCWQDAFRPPAYDRVRPATADAGEARRATRNRRESRDDGLAWRQG